MIYDRETGIADEIANIYFQCDPFNGVIVYISPPPPLTRE